MTNDLRTMPWTALFAAILGVVGSWLFPWTAVQKVYDDVHPVAVFSVSVVKSTSDSITLRLTAEKKRDCEFNGIHAFTRNALPMRDASIVRIDKPNTAETKPIGLHDLGVWMVWPTDGASSVVVYVKYDCEGRTVFVHAPEINL